MVCFVNDHQIPGLAFEQSLVTPLLLDPQFLQGRSHLVVSSPEIGSLCIRIASVDRHANVEHRPQPLVPLFNEQRRTDDEQPSYRSLCNQRPEHEPRLNGLSQADVVRNQPAGRPRFQDPPANPQLVG